MSHVATTLAVAREWICTPYHHRAKVLGVGCDCLMLIVAAYTAAGILPPDLHIPDYPPDIMFHTDDHSYLDGVLHYCDEVQTPAPGDLAMWRFGRSYCHGAIVSEWPKVIHAYAQYGQVLEMDVTEDSRLMRRDVRFFRPKVST